MYEDFYHTGKHSTFTTYFISMNFIILTFPFHVLISSSYVKIKWWNIPQFSFVYDKMLCGRFVTMFRKIFCFHFYCRYGKLEQRNEHTCMLQAEVFLLVIPTRKTSFNTVGTWWLYRELMFCVTDSFVCNTSQLHAMYLFPFPINCLNSCTKLDIETYYNSSTIELLFNLWNIWWK
jgi:hypothetical protein